jgi:hypothetical protein
MIFGFAWLAWAALDFFAFRKPKDGIWHLEIAACFGLQAVLIKRGAPKKRDRILILVGCLAVLAGIDWAIGLF